MASQVLTNAKLWLGGYDVSGDINSLALRFGAELQDATTLADTFRQRRPGLKNVSVSLAGFWNGGVGAIDDALFQTIGVNNAPVLVGPIGAGAEGQLAFGSVVDLGTYAPRGKVGDMFGFDVTAEGSDTLVRGTVLHNATRTTTGTGTIFQLGAVAAGQRICAGLHVTAASGTTPSLTVALQSAAAIGFASPTTRATFTAATAIGGQWVTVPGAITDQYWRLTWTISGTTPSFTFAGFAGIQ